MLETLHGVAVYHCSPEGEALATERDATDVLGEVYLDNPDLLAIPAARLTGDFFRLESGVAGALTQKFVQYGLRVAVLGDVSAHLEASEAFAAYVRECNRGRQVWFLADRAELVRKLGDTTGTARPTG
ncbi:DUF4180 domain-containing protein [Allosaccharopolyspora coralli]|uniref:DUF4180 domain-containing protein n=1 Tax=Allosaccharopolyspora coralli TaxID=2665642 RepID=A0A5Q3Q8P9_9PSEU|nr:DUF4180 domain-containing protein [Allosaccharopolyspora coralli]QGK69806.1 DUF4180 domain-containing protein [Allosaccharopolyspora coralli]